MTGTWIIQNSLLAKTWMEGEPSIQFQDQSHIWEETSMMDMFHHLWPLNYATPLLEI